jgi:hypothetical protein
MKTCVLALILVILQLLDWKLKKASRQVGPGTPLSGEQCAARLVDLDVEGEEWILNLLDAFV